ncbi:SPL family radical SAM protein [Anaerotignum sp.]|uniref:SPL family radical SAM protein n=1 Tax=Anaerotignum sp. TaxID=2039241 RepID=UPI0027145F08|nr:radical SAM protein [Anaerotignum sp.]
MEWIPAKTILSGYVENNLWFGTNYNMNTYKGCNHGCIYCDSRSSCYGIDHFDQVRAKKNALALLERELKAKRKRGVVGLGAMSDPYNPFEKEYCLTRGALERINRFGYGVAIATKSSLIERDIDLLKDISAHSPVLIKLTITTADDVLCRKIEPNVSFSSQRFQTIRMLSQEGIFTGILLMPVLPFLEDTEKNIAKIINLAHKNEAKFIYPAFGVTLRQNQREWFYDKLDRLFPAMKDKYIKAYGNSYECRSPNSESLWRVFKKNCDRYGLLYEMHDIVEAYKTPTQATQLSLF